MHALHFEIKGAHLSIARFARIETTPLGLTPDRLHMLRALVGRHGMYQHQLWRALCVCRSTVSVMVRALERLGFVKRMRIGRSVWIELTDMAKDILRLIYCETVGSGLLDLVHSIAVARPGASTDELEEVTWSIRTPLSQLRHELGIGSYNPWAEFELDEEAFYFERVPSNPNIVDLVPAWWEVPPFTEPDDPFANLEREDWHGEDPPDSGYKEDDSLPPVSDTLDDEDFG